MWSTRSTAPDAPVCALPRPTSSPPVIEEVLNQVSTVRGSGLVLAGMNVDTYPFVPLSSTARSALSEAMPPAWLRVTPPRKVPVLLTTSLELKAVVPWLSSSRYQPMSGLSPRTASK
jgi:hypothetical protein